MVWNLCRSIVYEGSLNKHHVGGSSPQARNQRMLGRTQGDLQRTGLTSRGMPNAKHPDSQWRSRGILSGKLLGLGPLERARKVCSRDLDHGSRYTTIHHTGMGMD